jgi:1-deoxy-D-xylulose-5-phosphate reductoisomerase
MTKKVAVLGATGSIGRSTLDVLRAAKHDFTPVLFTAHSRAQELAALAREFPNAKTVLGTHSEELLRAIEQCGADIVVNGIAGAAGLLPTLAVIESGADLALANKETVVMAWDIVSRRAAEKGAKIIPVDSEHSAVFSLINAHCVKEGDGEEEGYGVWGMGYGDIASSVSDTTVNLSCNDKDFKSEVSPKPQTLNPKPHLDEIILTASGGPFRNLSMEELKMVTPERALAHPTWNMGRKITIDSATLANKGLEVIEAARLFGVPPEKVKVVVHPQSIVHSMIRLTDGAVYAEMSRPDMRLPIHKALYYPNIALCPFARLEFTPPPLSLTFDEPDLKRFPMLRLAYEALAAGELYTVAYNAANEVAVAAFLENKIGFTDIPSLCEDVLQKDWSGSEPLTLEIILDVDKRAREFTVNL